MSTQPDLSCIVPVHNEAEYVARAVRSILDQGHDDIEVVVVDDASSDDSGPVAAAVDPRVRVVTIPEPIGPSAARNRGVIEAQGELVAFLDADDEWMPGKLDRQRARFAARDDLDISVTDVDVVFEDPSMAAEASGGGRLGAGVPGFATITLMARRRAFEVAGMLDEDRWFTDSVEWFVRAQQSGLALERIAEPLTRHWIRRRSLTRRNDERSREEWLDYVRESLAARRRGDQVEAVAPIPVAPSP